MNGGDDAVDISISEASHQEGQVKGREATVVKGRERRTEEDRR